MVRSRSVSGGLVYSTDGGRMCPVCRKPVPDCACRVGKPAPRSDGVVRVSRETKGRAGKTVTVVRGLALDAAALAALARTLKAVCGSGGTVRAGELEIQGDHCARVMQTLQEQGLRVKRAGA